MTWERLFVYGSLKRGFRHHEELDGAPFLGSSRTTGAYRLVRFGEYPAMVCGAESLLQEGPGVLGELYEVSDAQLRLLDEFEECPSVYQRTTVELADGSTALSYVISDDQAEGCSPIVGGRWQESSRATQGMP